MTTCPNCGSSSKKGITIIGHTVSVEWRDAHVELTPQEHEIFAMLLRHYPGRVVTERIIFRLWQGDERAHPVKHVHVVVHTLRKKIAPLGLRIAHHGGYCLNLTQAEQQQVAALTERIRRVAHG